MPRIRRRGVRRTNYGILTEAQHEQLLCGQAILNHTPQDLFQNDAEAQAGWLTHGAELMREYAGHHPGERPWGWWHFVRGQDKPRCWHDELGELERLHQIDRAEENAVERLRQLARWDVGHVEDEARGAIENMRVTYFNRYAPADSYGARKHLAELEFRRKWHESRGRADLAQFYGLCIGGLRELMGGGKVLRFRTGEKNGRSGSSD